MLAEGTGVARGKKKKKLKIIERGKIDFLSLCHPKTTHECPQKMSADLVQPFGLPEGKYIQMSCFLYRLMTYLENMALTLEF